MVPTANKKTEPLIGIVSGRSPSVDLVFPDLDDPNSRFILIDPRGSKLRMMRDLSRCGVVIISRELLDPHVRRATVMVRAARLPAYYFTDDNFIALSREYDALASHSLANMRPVVRALAGVIVTSDVLVDQFQRYGLHERFLRAFPVTPLGMPAARQRSEPGSRGELRIGCFGGAFRHDFLDKTIIPAMEQLNQKVRLFVPVTFAERADVISDRIDVEYVDYQPSFLDFLSRWSSLKLDIVVHPAASATDNLRSKTSNAVLVSWCLGAVPITADEPAYSALTEEHGVVKALSGIDDWSTALDKAIANRTDLLQRLGAFCEREYRRSRNDVFIQQISEGVTPVTGRQAMLRSLRMLAEYAKRMRYRRHGRW
jgi:hypothetical protein